MATRAKILEFANSSGDRLRTNRLRLESGGPTYVITLDWLPLADEGLGCWAFSMASTAGATAADRAVVGGVFLRDRTDALSGIVTPSRPPGAIMPYSATMRGDPRRDAFSTEGHLLLYLPDGYDPEDFIISEMAG